MSNILISTSYFPPISYLSAILQSEATYFEKHENFVKKTYRNRCRIYAANGIINLTVPVEEAVKRKVVIKDVKIDYSTNWQKQHFKSIESAYNSSPFYEYLVDEFVLFFEKEYTYLIDLNIEILKKVFELLEVDLKSQFSSTFEQNPENVLDLRSIISPKTVFGNPFIKSKQYTQVFSEKHGFVSDLSCLDLFFNLGSEAYSYLTE